MIFIGFINYLDYTSISREFRGCCIKFLRLRTIPRDGGLITQNSRDSFARILGRKGKERDRPSDQKCAVQIISVNDKLPYKPRVIRSRSIDRDLISARSYSNRWIHDQRHTSPH
jgi:hypothetical protein